MHTISKNHTTVCVLSSTANLFRATQMAVTPEDRFPSGASGLLLSDSLGMVYKSYVLFSKLDVLNDTRNCYQLLTRPVSKPQIYLVQSNTAFSAGLYDMEYTGFLDPDLSCSTTRSF